MSKKILMIVSSVLIVLLLFSITIPVFASTDAEALVGSFTPDTSGNAAQGITRASNSVLGIIQLVGTAVAIFFIKDFSLIFL